MQHHRYNNSNQFSAHVCFGQTAGWIKIPLGTEVGLGPGHIVLDRNPAPHLKREQPPLFGQCLLWPNGRPSQLLLSTCSSSYRYSLNKNLVVDAKSNSTQPSHKKLKYDPTQPNHGWTQPTSNSAIDMGRKAGGCCAPFGGTGSPTNTMCLGRCLPQYQ